MDIHKNASLTPKGREDMGASCGGLWVFPRCCHNAPIQSPSQTSRATCAAVEGLRRQRHTGRQIADELGFALLSLSTSDQTLHAQDQRQNRAQCLPIIGVPRPRGHGTLSAH
jgi:hypothetical protein